MNADAEEKNRSIAERSESRRNGVAYRKSGGWQSSETSTGSINGSNMSPKTLGCADVATRSVLLEVGRHRRRQLPQENASGECDNGQLQGGCPSANQSPETAGEEQGSAISKRGLYQLLERQKFRCALSGRPLTPETAVLDHKTPIARGGRNCLENVQWLHAEVNDAKGTMSQARFVSLCCNVASANGQTP